MRLSFLVLVPMLSGCIAYVTRMGGDANGGEFRLEAEDSYALRLGIRAALDEIGKECQGEYEITSVDLRPVASLGHFSSRRTASSARERWAPGSSTPAGRQQKAS